MSELVFLLTAYPWFLISFLLISALFVLRTRRGLTWQFRFERYFARIILWDLDVLTRTSERGHESRVLEVATTEVLDDFTYAFYDLAPDQLRESSWGGDYTCRDIYPRDFFACKHANQVYLLQERELVNSRLFGAVSAGLGKGADNAY
jgi:hypothetical protein